MIPLRDTNPTRSTPVVTFGLIGLNVLVFLYELTLESQGQLEPFFVQWAVIPAQLLNDPVGELPTVVSSMFLHGGWLHLLGNMLYLFIFGDNIEDRLGHFRFLVFYLVAGFLATATQVAISANSIVPNIGASGAIAGVLGAYLLEFPHSKVLTLVFRFLTEIPAYIVLGFWFVLQFLNGVMNLGALTSETGGVAFWAHIGGFVAGLLLIKPLQIGQRRAGWR
ncbi:MAG: rhomboid family intramembrane serine protease [Chloroflexi bacterium]|nr:rhomboid family intramembrane serine protease [Chloroflexota bacterium]MCI0575636.1 rhomboid family intramembrane serine protease [Chloroflexota bacterium]MCI0643484.1 rhomboid family intramembrane serine protease [Chloroflexota bacterium]